MRSVAISNSTRGQVQPESTTGGEMSSLLNYKLALHKRNSNNVSQGNLVL
jgi:hypothetical protein